MSRRAAVPSFAFAKSLRKEYAASANRSRVSGFGWWRGSTARAQGVSVATVLATRNERREIIHTAWRGIARRQAGVCPVADGQAGGLNSPGASVV